MAELTGGKLLVKPPKSDAGKRTVSIPAVLVKELRAHLQEYVRGPADILIFTGGTRGTPKRGAGVPPSNGLRRSTRPVYPPR